MRFDCLIPPTLEPAELSLTSSLLSLSLPYFFSFLFLPFASQELQNFQLSPTVGVPISTPSVQQGKKRLSIYDNLPLLGVCHYTHGGKNPLFGLSFLPSSLHSPADSFTIFKVRLTIYKKAEREGVDLIISQLGIGLAHKLLKTVSTLHNHNLGGRKKALKYRRPLGTLLFYFILCRI